MRKVSDKICKENRNKYLFFNNLFPKIVPLKRCCGKIW